MIDAVEQSLAAFNYNHNEKDNNEMNYQGSHEKERKIT